MHISRRVLMKGSLGSAAALLLGPHLRAEGGSPPILVNHVGFAPAAAKRCLVRAASRPSPAEFEIVNASGATVHRGQMQAVQGDFGTHLIGDFSALAEAGKYTVRADGWGAARFEVKERIYQDAIDKCVRYFARQRCGDSKSGYQGLSVLGD